MMNDDEMIELVEKCGDTIIEIMDGAQMTGDDITTFWATLIGNISDMIYDANPQAIPWAACKLTAGKLNFIADKLRKEREDERRVKGKKL